MPVTKVQFRVPDLHCEGCASRVTNVLERLKGVRSADVSFEEKTAEVDLADGAIEFDDLKAAVEKAGYTVETE
jgi:copper chaperone CopZ